jgi:phage terminase small subunit
MPGKTNEYGLTPREEAFAQAMITAPSAAEAYRIACPPRSGRPRTAKTEHEEGCRLAAVPKVAARINQLRGTVLRKASEKLEITVETLTEELIADREAARAHRQYSVAVSASAQIAKLHGLEVEARKNGRDPFEGLTVAQIRDSLAAVREAIARAKEVA